MDIGGMPPEGLKLPAARRIPDDYSLVVAARGKALAVRAEGEALDRRAVTAKGTHLLARRHVPQPDGAIPVCRGEALAIRTESYASGRGLVAGQVEQFQPRCCVPDLHLARPRFLI